MNWRDGIQGDEGRASLAVRLAGVPEAERRALWRSLGPKGVAALLHDWQFWGRPSQLPPPGDWRVWLVLAGRGFGKTRAGAEWVRNLATRSAGQASAPSAGKTRARGPAGWFQGTAGAAGRGCHLRHFTENQLAADGAAAVAAEATPAESEEQRMGAEHEAAVPVGLSVMVGSAGRACGAAAPLAEGAENEATVPVEPSAAGGSARRAYGAETPRAEGAENEATVPVEPSAAGGSAGRGPGALTGSPARVGPVRIALVAATLAEARAVMVEGESGLLAIAPPHERPRFEPALRRLVWPNGSIATLYSADAPEQLRGAQHHFAWCDELAKWRNAETVWANLQMGLRLGDAPRAMVTTTPRPQPLIRQLLADPTVAVTRGATWDNEANLPASFIAAMTSAYGGTRLGRQELEGEMIEAVEGALWSPDLIERCRTDAPPPLARVVVAVDPPVTSGPKADACGIIAAGLGTDGIAYVLADRSLNGASPEGWARAAEAAASEFNADRVVAEANNGGDLVGLVLRSVNAALPVKLVRAARGKSARAEPVAALYEQGKVRHIGILPKLEDELCGLLPGGGYIGPSRSPDRADALVWALTELMLNQPAAPRVRTI